MTHWDNEELGRLLHHAYGDRPHGVFLRKVLNSLPQGANAEQRLYEEVGKRVDKSVEPLRKELEGHIGELVLVRREVVELGLVGVSSLFSSPRLEIVGLGGTIKQELLHLKRDFLLELNG